MRTCSFEHRTKMQFWTHSKTELFFFRVYKGPESLSPMAISLALNCQWQLQLALNSPMAVATCLLAWKSLKKQAYEAAPETCQFDWRFPLACISLVSLAIWSLHVHIAIARSDSFTETKLASGTGSLAAACMHFTSKRAPLGKLFENDPIWKKSF